MCCLNGFPMFRTGNLNMQIKKKDTSQIRKNFDLQIYRKYIQVCEERKHNLQEKK